MRVPCCAPLLLLCNADPAQTESTPSTRPRDRPNAEPLPSLYRTPNPLGARERNKGFLVRGLVELPRGGRAGCCKGEMQPPVRALQRRPSTDRIQSSASSSKA